MSGDIGGKPVTAGRIIGWAFGAIGAVVALAVIFGIIGTSLGWFNAGREVVSASNTKNQFREIKGDWAELNSAAGNACSVVGNAKGSDAQSFVEDPAVAYAATYRRIVADYNRRMDNIFEAQLVGPKDYPRAIPEFDETKGQNPDWCGVTSQLDALKAEAESN